MIAVVTFIAAMAIFIAGTAAIASGWRGEYRRRRQAPGPPGQEADLMSEIEEWLRQQQ